MNADLLRGAAEAFERFGWHGATLERIAEASGTTRVTLHRNGITKRALLDALAEEGARDYAVAMLPALTAPGTALERLDVALETLCDQAERHKGLLLALRAQTDAVFHGEGGEALTRSPFTDPLERLLRDGSADDSLRMVDAQEYATVLFNLVGWTYLHLRTGHGWQPERARQTVVEIALEGLAARPGD